MAIFAIGDLHLSLGGEKPMDVFPGWKDYVPRIEAGWRAHVSEEDTVVLAGDTSWAMRLEDCRQDFAFLHALPGRKVLLKGNHDYWWTTMRKMERFLQAEGFDSLSFLHNSCVQLPGAALCGTRGWMFDCTQPHDEKVMARECGRLRASLDAAGEGEKIVFLHYPPVYPGANAAQILDILHEYGVRRCYYGHLHGASIRSAVNGEVDGVAYRLISADALDFCPLPIEV